MTKHFWLISFVLLVAGCAGNSTRSDLFNGENLITPFMLELRDWEIRYNDLGNFHSRIWHKPGRGYADSYAVSVTYQDTSSPTDKRKLADQPGIDSCTSFESVTLTFPTLAGYQVEYWETLCQNGETFKAKMLHLMIRGNDSFYHLQKSWQNDFTDQDIDQWKARFEQVFVCDTRLPNAPCPNIQRVDGS